MTDLKYTPLTLAVRDAVVAWLDTDPTMAPLGQHADARALEAAHDRLLPVLAAALWVSRGVDHNILADIGDAERLVRPEDRADSRTHLLALKEIVRAHPDTNAARLLAYHEAVALLGGGEPGSVAASGFDLAAEINALAFHLADLCSEALGHGSHDPSGTSGVLAKQVAYLQRWLLQTMKEREERASALAFERHHSIALAERDATIADLRDHLSRETKSAESARGIADELSVALEASRALVADRDDHLMAIRTALGCDDGVTTIVAEITRLREACAATVIDVQTSRRALETCREAIEGCNDIDDLLHMRDMIGLACNNVGLHRAVHPEEGPVYRWAADQGPPLPLVPEDELQLGAARIRELEATLSTERQQHARDVDDLRDRMADPEGMSHAWDARRAEESRRGGGTYGDSGR